MSLELRFLGTSLFIIFVQFWAPNNDKLKFTIHGVWPEYYNNTYPEYCNKSVQFNLSQIEYLIPILNIDWVSYEGSNQDFWKHEYLKHGTCYPGVTEERFFLNALYLFHKSNTTNIFMRNKIRTNWSYPKKELDVIFEGTFQCKEDLNSSINTIWYCYDLNFNIFECPKWLENSCAENVIFEI